MWISLLALLAFQSPPPEPGPVVVADGPLVHRVEDAAGLLSWSWDGESETPFSGTPGPLVIEWGAARLSPDTMLLESFDATTADGEPVRSVDGRFGNARVIGRDDWIPMRVSMTEIALGWTLELWLKPDPDAHGEAGALLLVPGITESVDVSARIELSLLPGGVLHVEVLAPSPSAGDESRSTLELHHPRHLSHGDWHHVSLCWTEGDLAQLRLSVDGENIAIRRSEWMARFQPTSLSLGSRGSEQALACAVDDLRLSRRELSTAELAARADPVPSPGPHTLSLRYEDGVLDVPFWYGAIDEPEPSLETLAAGGRLEHVVHVGDGLRWAEGHWWEADPDVRPAARTTHPTVHIGDGRVFTFSGEVRDTHLEPMVNRPDTWIFHMGTEQWERIETDVAPPGACHQGAAYSPDHDLVLYVGGWVNEEVPYRESSGLWVFHTDELRWEERQPEGAAVPEISGCAVVYHEQLELFLLYRGERIFGYDPVRNVWSELPRPPVVLENGRVPLVSAGFPGTSMMAGYHPPTRAVALFGGENWVQAEHVYQGTTAVHLPVGNLLLLTETQVAPAPRVRSGFAYDSRRDRFVLFGGVLGQGSQRFDDLWSYDPDSRSWARHDASGGPTARGGFYDMAYDAELDRFALLCGRHSRERFLDGAWLLELDPEAEGRARWVFDRASFDGLDHLEVESRVGDGALEVAYRGSPDGAVWGPWSADATAAIDSAARFVEVSARLGPPQGLAPSELLRLAFTAGHDPQAVSRVADSPPAGDARMPGETQRSISRSRIAPYSE
jgi:hypothetical protein